VGMRQEAFDFQRNRLVDSSERQSRDSAGISLANHMELEGSALAPIKKGESVCVWLY
jgi:hypothetical protein